MSPGATQGEGRGGRRSLLGWSVLLWALLLGASHLVRGPLPEPNLGPDEGSFTAQVFDGGERSADGEGVRIVWREMGLPGGGVTPVVLLHGSPGRRRDFDAFAPFLASERRTIAPDLPGFGLSEHDVPNYSIRAHADYVLQLLDHLELPRVHVVGYSMGGGVGLHLTELAPERVASLTLLSAIGVQELELFGDYGLNHAVHGAQLFGLWLVHEGLPHFGLLDGSFLSRAYARNFYDTDQRPLRAALSAWAGPTLILHGESDPLVPFAAALEAARLVPQSEMVGLDGGHMLLFGEPERLARELGPFLARVDADQATVRSGASTARVERAAQPFDASALPPLGGMGLLLFGVLAGLGTLVSEDLTCVGVGALVAAGRVPFWPGALACFLGIYVGDLLLFLAGRFLGRGALERAPLRWFLTPEKVERSSAWFRAKGPWVIFASRFLPGARLPTYFAAGALRTSLLSFSFWFALAAGIWTPLLVWLAGFVGGELSDRVGFLQRNFFLALVVTLVAVVMTVRLLLPCATHRGRRLLVSRWRRLTRWEFWPPWVFYPPIVVYVLWLWIRHRGASFTAVNPAMPLSGFIGESKGTILGSLAGHGRFVPPTVCIPAGKGADEKLALAARFREEHDLGLPLVLKPDVGQRGSGVRVVRTEEELREELSGAEEDLLIQAFVDGPEYGLFWIDPPGDEQGILFSVAEKRLPSVTGDGVRNLERLILGDERAVCMARFHLQRQERHLDEIPSRGEVRSLGDLGTHCLGAMFLDARHLESDALHEAVRGLARSYPGFHFGRFDVRAPSAEALMRGEFSVLELNGVTAEAAHIYDPRLSLWNGWRTIARQWRWAFEIGSANVRAGAHQASLGELARALIDFSSRRG